MFCKKCGANLQDSAVYCTQCGEKVQVHDSTQSTKGIAKLFEVKLENAKKMTHIGTIASVFAFFVGNFLLRLFADYVVEEEITNQYDEEEFLYIVLFLLLLNVVTSITSFIILRNTGKKISALWNRWQIEPVSTSEVVHFFSVLNTKKIQAVYILNIITALNIIPFVLLYAAQIYACYTLKETKKYVLENGTKQ